MPAYSKTELARLVTGYRLCAKTEGKSPRTIQAVADSAAYLERFRVTRKVVPTFSDS